MSTLFTQVVLIDPGTEDGTSSAVDVLVEGNRIAAVGPDLGDRVLPETRMIQGAGKLLMPGLVNAHFHSPVNHMKGRLASLPLEVFMLYESPTLDALKPTPREAYVRTLLAAMEMLKTGTTSVQDDAFFVPHPTPDLIDAVCQAYADCGIRATIALDQPELPESDKLPFLETLLPADLAADLRRVPAFGRADLIAAYRHLFSRWHGAADGRIRAATSISAPQRVSPAYFAELDALSAHHGTPIYAHMLETKLQRVLKDEQPRFAGRSLVRYTADLGLLSERLNIIHAIWVDDADLDLIAEAGSVIAHNPISNLRLGSGVMPFRRIRDRGIPICLGSDEAIADDAVNMWAVAKLAGLIHNLDTPVYERWPAATEVLDCLIGGGARACGLGDQLGKIAPGQLADLILVDLDTLAFTPLNDLPRQLVYCENGSSVVLTMVDGRIICEGGRLTTLDEAALRAEARDLFAGRRGALAEAAVEAERWLPSYRAMLGAAEARDIGMHRRIGSFPSNR